MDEAGGSGNAATSRVEVMQGQCGEKGFVDLGVPLDQRMAEAEMLAPNNSQNKENSNHSHLFYGVDCVQMDWTLDGTSVLRVSGDFGQKYTTGFWVHMAGEPGVYARFSFLGSVKGQMLFSAVQWRLETDQQLSPPSPPLPFPKNKKLVHTTVLMVFWLLRVDMILVLFQEPFLLLKPWLLWSWLMLF